MGKKTSKIKRQKFQADGLWKVASAIKWGNNCIMCNDLMSAYHHFIPRSRSSLLRYDILNSIPLCQKHHYIIHFDVDPTKQADIVKKIELTRGKEWCDYIYGKRGIINPNANKTWWVKEQIEILEKIIGK